MNDIGKSVIHQLIRPNPVPSPGKFGTLGLVQIDLDLEVKRASKGTAAPDEADEAKRLGLGSQAR